MKITLRRRTVKNWDEISFGSTILYKGVVLLRLSETTSPHRTFVGLADGVIYGEQIVRDEAVHIRGSFVEEK